jgi:hypothetical protein
MTMVLLISYDLNGHERPSAYQAVKAVIEKNAIASIKPLFSQWLVETNANPSAWRDELQKVMDANDRLLIVRMHRGNGTEYAGWLDKTVWPWLEGRL